MGGSQPATSETDGANSPPPDVAAPAPQAAGAAPLAPNLPVVDWLQWGVIARLVVVAFVFTYNRNMTTEKMTIMAGKQPTSHTTRDAIIPLTVTTTPSWCVVLQ